MDYVRLGSKIREQRLKKELTQEKLAEKCGISPSYIGIIERGDKKLSITTLVKIASVLDISTDYLLSDSLDISQDTRLKQVLSDVKDLKNDEMDLLINVVNTITRHYSK
ncbi:helix-turn-helix domain-containing protein [Vallitalea guaymasensis]|uniref:helix-turn-helix domain-containing protein n=1 Tax=Vallitalea guaymasensis TaxID=1185412 RepID=UPI00187D69E6|nr:helix-turn-helix transcriptional regulator [Vallitalea guaymasensis]